MPEKPKPGKLSATDPNDAAESAHRGLSREVNPVARKDAPELDDFGLPVKKVRSPSPMKESSDEESKQENRNGDVGSGDNGGNDRTVNGEQNGSLETPAAVNESVLDSKGSRRDNGTPSGQPDDLPTNSPNNGRISDSVIPEGMFFPQDGDGYYPAKGVSEWSHQQVAPHNVGRGLKKEDEQWQDMPAFAPYDLYDDNGKLVAREAQDSDEEADAYGGLGGAGKGYTRVQIDDDARSATSMDENTSYLFKEKGTNVVDEDEEQRDPLAQMQATKDLLTEGQRIAYVGVTRLAMVQMVRELEDIDGTKGTKKDLRIAVEAMKMWSQKMMVRLYAHMEIDPAEQIMIEQLAEHGVEPRDLTPTLMQNSRVKNPMAEDSSSARASVSSPRLDSDDKLARSSTSLPLTSEAVQTPPPPPYEEHGGEDLPEVRTPSQLPKTKNIDIDLRWTVLCDLFLVLIADSIYDSRSRLLLERVGASMEVPWLEICRFEKRVTDALEMQEAADKENWNEAEHMENRRKLALKRKYMMMGLATVGGSLVIGLSAGLLAPVIGAGLAAGFTTIGVAGTSGFLAGAGGTALITSGAVVTGGTIAVRASHRRTGAVQTFEYRPLHNNKRVNLIVTISGWMNGKIDDVRLPYSTVDPIMGDMYSVLWEPEMLQSMGDTINILATEALTQGLQQVLGSTILVALMASLQLPIVLTKLAYLIDNPWTVSLDRANMAGLILADSLIDRNLGVRPITLVGFSLGSRVIFSCLRELASKGAFGLIQNVYLFGSPIVGKKDEYLRARTVVSGRFVNGYASNDWILGYLFRATSGGIMRVAGLAPVEEIPGLENIDVTQLVNGHMAYRAAMPRLLREVGWEVESDEFTEIEAPDPENHEKRQRELIHELDEARKEAEAKPEKRRFGFFRRGKLAEKKGWEMYDDRTKEEVTSSSNDGERGPSNVLFDVEAIRAELASEEIEVKQLESTLPPMKLNLNGTGSSVDKALQSPYSNLRETKSFDASMVSRPSATTTLPQTDLRNGHDSNRHRFDRTYDKEDDAEGFAPRADGESEVRMTFDSSYHTPTRSDQSTQAAEIPLNDHSPAPFSSSTPTTLQRPELRSSATMPADLSGLSLEHNAWAEDDDQDFGKEKEMKMSFA
ncbi:MAG: Transmembrane and coiled-coil domain-containing protein 4 [Pleopsidium flavum]|nr:MAG: Transmembrane and coiled-coil domain-containing protein 4 [Pleopsidium flavum]